MRITEKCMTHGIPYASTCTSVDARIYQYNSLTLGPKHPCSHMILPCSEVLRLDNEKAGLVGRK